MSPLVRKFKTLPFILLILFSHFGSIGCSTDGAVGGVAGATLLLGSTPSHLKARQLINLLPKVPGLIFSVGKTFLDQQPYTMDIFLNHGRTHASAI